MIQTDIAEVQFLKKCKTSILSAEIVLLISRYLDDLYTREDRSIRLTDLLKPFLGEQVL